MLPPVEFLGKVRGRKGFGLGAPADALLSTSLALSPRCAAANSSGVRSLNCVTPWTANGSSSWCSAARTRFSVKTLKRRLEFGGGGVVLAEAGRGRGGTPSRDSSSPGSGGSPP